MNWGKWLRTSAPGPVPYISFQLCVYELCSCLLPIKSRFYFPLPIFPIPLPPLLFPSSTFPSSSSTCSLPAKPGRTGGFFSSVSLEPPPFYLPLYCTLHLSPNTSLFHCTASSYTSTRRTVWSQTPRTYPLFLSGAQRSSLEPTSRPPTGINSYTRLTPTTSTGINSYTLH